MNDADKLCYAIRSGIILAARENFKIEILKVAAAMTPFFHEQEKIRAFNKLETCYEFAPARVRAVDEAIALMQEIDRRFE